MRSAELTAAADVVTPATLALASPWAPTNHLAPVVFGSGTRLFEGLEGEHISLESIEVIQTAEAIHMRFRVVK